MYTVHYSILYNVQCTLYSIPNCNCKCMQCTLCKIVETVIFALAYATSIGTQVAVNLHQWMTLGTASWEIAKDIITEEDVKKCYDNATTSMSSLNLTAAKLMHKHG